MVKLHPHQKKVVDTMVKSDSRGIILIHGLGSGKTITSIAIAESFPTKKVVVIVPASMRTQWDKELKFMKVNQKRYTVLSYQGFLSKSVENKDFLKGKIALVDEAHRIRSEGSTIATKATKALQTAYKVVMLTGTPMVNGPVDMSPLINAIEGENVLPINDKMFKQTFYMPKSKKLPPDNKRCSLFSPITCSENGLASKLGLCKYHFYMKMRRSSAKIKRENKWKSDKEYINKQKERIALNRHNIINAELEPNVNEYAKYIRCLISYYMPEKTKDYPSVKEKYIKVKMSSEQDTYYSKATKKLTKAEIQTMNLGRKVKSSTSFNAFMNFTRQISNTTNNNANTPKLKAILKKIKDGPLPCIVYSNWLRSGINPMKELLDKNGISNVSFTGALTDKKKDEYVKMYNNGEVDVLLLSSSGGEGLDLKNTRQIHIMEPHWNMAKIAQVKGRGIRYKSHEQLPVSKRNVVVYYWIATPITKQVGADEYLYQMSEDKTKEIGKFLNVVIKSSIEKAKCV
jgi:superfamily II DNA or RNA helicase